MAERPFVVQVHLCRGHCVMTVLKALYVRSPYYDREISPLALGINLYILADHYIKEIYCELSKIFIRAF